MTAQSGRLLLDAPAAGSWNMAVDQMLLERADQIGEITLRFYFWERPTLSLGYFQPMEDRSLHSGSRNCPVVRRSTGGGAIVHDREITYSLCIPSKDRWSQCHDRLYRLVHECVIRVLRGYGWEARIYESESESENPTLLEQPSRSAGNLNSADLIHRGVSDRPMTSANPFLCFQRRTAGDIVCGTHKIVGSAQRRMRSSILQHGSLLLSRSEFAPELPGIVDLQPLPEFHHSVFINELAQQIGNLLGVQWIPFSLNNREIEMVRTYEKTQHSSDWLEKKSGFRISRPGMRL